MTKKLYPESKIELSPAILKHYDRIMNSISFGKYHKFIVKAVKDMDIQNNDSILDLGCGSGKNASLMKEYLGEEGHITGIDLSPEMEKQFLKKHKNDNRMSFISARIDIPFKLEQQFDKVVISFVIHGFPQEVRKAILQNAYNHLKPGGQLIILDYSEFDIATIPVHHRIILKAVECKYAFDFIERDWKEILSGLGFSNSTENLYFKKYARLLAVSKN